MLVEVLSGLLLFSSLVVAWKLDGRSHHPYLGLGSEQNKIEHGAEWTECPDCGGRTAIYKGKQEGSSPGSSTNGCICGNCGAKIIWDEEKQSAVVATPGEEVEPYDWK